MAKNERRKRQGEVQADKQRKDRVVAIAKENAYS